MVSPFVVLSGFQRYFCMLYTTFSHCKIFCEKLFYQDFKDTFVCYTQPISTPLLLRLRCFIRISKILLYAIHNGMDGTACLVRLFYQDFKDTFVCYTQRSCVPGHRHLRCFIRISKILLYAIHNLFQPRFF